MANRSKKTAAVIGSGFGGLSTAIRLQKLGFDVTVFEKRDLPGGRAYVYKDQGFTFDAGPTVITAPECLEELFELHGKRMSDYVELTPVHPFYRLHWGDGSHFDYSNDMKLTLDQIRDFSGEDDVLGYQKFLKYSKKVFDAGYKELVHVPFLDWWSMIRNAPELIKLKAHTSVYSRVAKYIKNEKLREAFSFHSLLVGGNPFSASSIYTLIHYLELNWGVHFPKGGTHALVRSLVQLLEDTGGKIRYESEIDEILCTQDQVRGIRLKSGEVNHFDVVVSNAEVMHTYGKLLRNVRSTEPTAKKLSKMKYSMSLFLIYFGTKKQYPNLAHHNVIFGPRYKGLLKDIFKKGILPEDFSLYLHVPTRTDASLAPEGCEGFYALSPVAHLGKMDLDWEKEGPRYADSILNFLEKNHLPGLRENIVTQRIFTPIDFRDTLNSHHGAAFSLEPTLTQSAYFRTHNRDSKIKGLYFVGAGTHPGAGVPGVINSGKATASVVESDYFPKGVSLRSESEGVEAYAEV